MSTSHYHATRSTSEDSDPDTCHHLIDFTFTRAAAEERMVMEAATWLRTDSDYRLTLFGSEKQGHESHIEIEDSRGRTATFVVYTCGYGHEPCPLNTPVDKVLRDLDHQRAEEGA